MGVEALRAAVEADGRARIAETLREAVQVGFEAAGSGDTVLLSPACASFDMFESYEHRGRAFKEAVAGLKRGSANSARTQS